MAFFVAVSFQDGRGSAAKAAFASSGRRRRPFRSGRLMCVSFWTEMTGALPIHPVTYLIRQNRNRTTLRSQSLPERFMPSEARPPYF
jgi:hypothetical protein